MGMGGRRDESLTMVNDRPPELPSVFPVERRLRSSNTVGREKDFMDEINGKFIRYHNAICGRSISCCTAWDATDSVLDSIIGIHHLNCGELDPAALTQQLAR